MAAAARVRRGRAPSVRTRPRCSIRSWSGIGAEWPVTAWGSWKRAADLGEAPAAAQARPPRTRPWSPPAYLPPKIKPRRRTPIRHGGSRAAKTGQLQAPPARRYLAVMLIVGFPLDDPSSGPSSRQPSISCREPAGKQALGLRPGATVAAVSTGPATAAPAGSMSRSRSGRPDGRSGRRRRSRPQP